MSLLDRSAGFSPQDRSPRPINGQGPSALAKHRSPSLRFKVATFLLLAILPLLVVHGVPFKASLTDQEAATQALTSLGLGAGVLIACLRRPDGDPHAAPDRHADLRSLVENSQDPIVRLDRDGRQVYANPAMARLLGRAPQEILGKRLRDLDLPPAVWQPARETLNRVLQTGTEESVELSHRFAGVLRHFEARCVPEHAPDGQISSVLVIAREVTDRKRAETAQRESFARQLMLAQEKERERIASELHDGLGQIVLALKHHAERGLLEPLQPDRMQNSLHSVIALAGQTVHEIRNIVRHLHPHLLKRLGLTRALRAMIETTDHSSPIRFTSDIPPLERRLDPEAEVVFYRVIQECLNNIVKHSRATIAHIQISLHPDHLLASVRDDGCGFDPEHPESSDDQPPGWGLRGISERMTLLGGSSRFLSQPGQGTRVELHLPLSSAPPPPPHAGGPESSDAPSPPTSLS